MEADRRGRDTIPPRTHVVAHSQERAQTLALLPEGLRLTPTSGGPASKSCTLKMGPKPPGFQTNGAHAPETQVAPRFPVKVAPLLMRKQQRAAGHLT